MADIVHWIVGQHQEIGAFSRFDSPDFIRQPQGDGAVVCRDPEYFKDGNARVGQQL